MDATFTLLPPLFWKVGNLDIVNAADPAFVMDMTTIVSSAVKDGLVGLVLPRKSGPPL